jgi:hypothetical protein
MKFYFHHIGKTAGSTFRRYLVEQVGEANVSPMLRGVKFGDALRDYANFTVIGGHIVASPGDTLPADRVSFTLLRDPLDRTQSEYCFRRTVHLHARSPAARDAGTLDGWLGSLTESDRFALNAQLAALWAFGWDAQLPPTEHQKIDAAKRSLEKFDSIGLQDELDLSVAMFARRAGLNPPTELPRANATPARIAISELGDATLGRLRRWLEPDYEIYHRALMLFGGQRRLFGAPRLSSETGSVTVEDLRGPSTGSMAPRDDARSIAQPAPIAPRDHGDNAETGDRALRITAVGVRGLFTGDATVQVGETVTIDVEFRADAVEELLTVGIALRDHLGSLVFGTNTRLLGDNLAVVPGDYVVSFTFRNDLGLGRYWVTAALHRGASELERCFHRWERASHFEVVDTLTEYFEGRFRLDVAASARAISADARVVATPSQGDQRDKSWVIGKRNPVLQEFTAELTPQASIVTLPRARDMLVEMKVANRSRETWNAYGRRSVRISYHWLDDEGSTVDHDGLRTPLPRDVAPGESIVVPCFLRAPETAGEFRLAWTLVQEEVAWFDERNASSRAESRVSVT